ncbi:hypothetical protein HOY80DRAFT_1038540 [Tuber brumale]|nr:hypothetical protein HOY80DRAFT_1038540 [Tuber brumale]
MLTKILDTRIMMKNGMKHDKNDKILQRLLNSRELAPKLIANVTYGIVQTGRKILEKAARLFQEDLKWKADVVYSDRTVSSSTSKAAQRTKPSAWGKKSRQYEYRQQVEPGFDAKGIETVRRDGTPTKQMFEEAGLKILFRTKDLSYVKPEGVDEDHKGKGVHSTFLLREGCKVLMRMFTLVKQLFEA